MHASAAVAQPCLSCPCSDLGVITRQQRRHTTHRVDADAVLELVGGHGGCSGQNERMRHRVQGQRPVVLHQHIALNKTCSHLRLQTLHGACGRPVSLQAHRFGSSCSRPQNACAARHARWAARAHLPEDGLRLQWQGTQVALLQHRGTRCSKEVLACAVCRQAHGLSSSAWHCLHMLQSGDAPQDLHPAS